MSETYLMTLTVPQCLLLLVTMRVAHDRQEVYLTQQLLPKNHDLRPLNFSLSAHNLIVTAKVFTNFAKRYPTVTALVQSAIDRAFNFAKHHLEIAQALTNQPDLPKPTPDYEVSLQLSARQRQRLATYCFLNIETRLEQTTYATLGQLIPSIILLDKLLPQKWTLRRQLVLLDDVDAATLAPILFGVSANYAGFEPAIRQLLDGVKAHDSVLWGLLNDLSQALNDDSIQ